MYSQSVERLRPGSVLGRTVYDGAGRPLLVAGTEITDRYVRALSRHGVSSVLVRDGLADDVVPNDIVSERVRSTLTGHVATAFDRVAMIAKERSAAAGGVDAAVARLGEEQLDIGDDGERSVADLYSDVEGLIAEILEGDTIAGLESLKTHNEYTFQHSVDVAVVGVLLGKRVGLPLTRLRELALGCLLHDIGKTYIDVGILDKRGPLTAEEFATIQEHPRMGFELVRRMPVHSILPAHVAFQHHEQQGGSGYPRGLVGDNRIGNRATRERVGPGHMLLIAEIAAIADVYSALSSDRPYRAGLPPDQVMTTLQGMAGAHLNRQLLAELRHLVPSYPVGRWVQVTQGDFLGWRGVVTEVHQGSVDQPSLRLMVDASGEEVASPVELDTRRHPAMQLACLETDQVPTGHLAALVS
jgi:HD-GYP domain-containing protein (c-di-GMP phosphodiesterase class II)